MKSLPWLAFAQAVAGAIVFVGIVSVGFALTGEWPPQAALIGASVGGAMSPYFWRWVRTVRREEEAEPEGGAAELPRS